jgi:hypothetical protein
MLLELAKKLLGIVLILIGGTLVLFFPSTKQQQPRDEFTIAAIIIGLIFLFIGMTFVLT